MLELTLLRSALYMRTWRPPGRGGRGICGFCSGKYKFIADAPVIRDLPHEVSHFLAWELHVEYNRMYEALVDREADRSMADTDDFHPQDDRQARLAQLARQLEDDLLTALEVHRPELDRARIVYIEPKIEAYAEQLVESLIGYVQGGAD